MWVSTTRFLTVKYFPNDSEETSYTLFDDDRKSPTSLQDGKYQLTTFTARREGTKLLISLESEGKYADMPESRLIALEIPATKRPKAVLYNGERLMEASTPKAIRNSAWSYDAATRTLTVGFGYAYTPLTLTIE